MQMYFKKFLKKVSLSCIHIVCIVTYAMQITHSERKKEQEMNC